MLAVLAYGVILTWRGDSVRDQQDASQVAALRREILRDIAANEDRSREVASAYRKLFTRFGLAGLPALMEDSDTSIALQAAWEFHRKVVRRPRPIEYRTDWILDKEELKSFLRVVAKRLGSQPPNWWRVALLNADAFPGQHHAFFLLEKPPETAKARVERETVLISEGTKSIRMAKSDFERAGRWPSLEAPPVAHFGPDFSFVTRPTFRGYPFNLFAFDSATDAHLWTATVWAARRGMSTGNRGENPVEIRRSGAIVLVYGCESHGLYLEGFDARTGACKFRFCSCYWFNNSEKWRLK